ncbi:phosphopantetheine-binding protein [Streptomyces sp. NBC_01210]|uniref:Pls/PosA family non-ribosomal peptide synthetase n=1 Tax=Streptomyces sp. NBC_01210 TaxID=2903774 RepID=UPI002E0D0EE6|nr:phosphopantetheine-binding protein [Streptomyces sp. NBC_01210]
MSSETTTGTDGAAVGTEGLLAEVLAGVLRTERVPVDGDFFADLGADSLVMAQFCARVRKRDDLPTVSMKDIYQHSTVRSLAAAFTDSTFSPPQEDAPSDGVVESPTDVPAAGTKSPLGEVLAGVLGTEQVPVDGNFFTDLGADSLVMAQFCARVRKRDDLPTVSMKDIYRHPTISSLAAAFADAPAAVQPAAPGHAPSQPSQPAPGTADAPSDASGAPQSGPWRYMLCGTAQMLMFLVFSSLGATIAVLGYDWTLEGSGTAGVYLRAVFFSTALFLGICALPIAAKWILIGRFTPRRFPVWSSAYLRFWCVKTLIRTSPVRLFTGSPLYVLYLRALGARIGKDVAILSRTVPVCTDLLSIGDGTVVRKDVLLSCYRAHDGWIEMGPVTLGADVTVSEQAVIDIGTSMGDDTQLGHASSLHSGQAVPAGESWHGTPAQPTTTDFRAVEPSACGPLRRALYSLSQLLAMLLVYLPLTLAGVSLVFTVVPQLNAVFTPGPPAFTSPTFYLEALVASLMAFFGGILVGLLVVSTVPRLLSLAIKPGRTYPLYGFHHSIQRAITRLTNIRFFTTLFGDSSAIVHYLRCLGYNLCNIEQTGSNFGTLVKHDTPYLSTVGSGTMVADGLSIINADFSSSSFRFSPTSIGPSNFLGNRIAYPSRGRTGDNCLLATKVMVPIDGPVREGVGLLGSPSFEIPRTVLRDTQFDHLAHGDELRRRLAVKNRHNALTAGLHLLVRWFHFFVLALITMAAVELYRTIGVPAFVLAGLLTWTFTVVYFALVERAVTRIRPVKPLNCSIYEADFWGHERFWKLTSHQYMQAFNGTPFKSMVWRLLGVRIGRRVFDDGCSITERTLVSIGDGCTLNAGTVIQCHSQEDGAFKSDHATIGAGVTLGVNTLVHYGTTIGDRAQLAADSFLMKGEEVPSQARWGGNPAREDTAVARVP